jgi:GH24 family phage-related lysozyme (muramidase)
MALTFDEIKLFIAPFEGNIPHMYLDTEGFVTVGIGNMLPSSDAASALAFTNRATQNPATKEEIKTDFDSVSAQEKAKAAKYYRQFTKLDFPDIEVNRLFQIRVAEFQKQLRQAYSDHDTYPDPAQLALLDMAFNLGTGALKKKWPKLNQAIDKQDWVDAAEQCNRPGANAVRNAGTKALFEQAARPAEKTTP